MQNITLIGIDLGKHSFHVHCQDNRDKVLLRKVFSPEAHRVPLRGFRLYCRDGSLRRCPLHGPEN